MKVNQDRWETFNEALEDNLYFNMSGCERFTGLVKIPEEWFIQILNWAGACTDPSESEDFYKNPRAMFVALDLIYQLLNSIEYRSSGGKTK